MGTSGFKCQVVSDRNVNFTYSKTSIMTHERHLISETPEPQPQQNWLFITETSALKSDSVQDLMTAAGGHLSISKTPIGPNILLTQQQLPKSPSAHLSEDLNQDAETRDCRKRTDWGFLKASVWMGVSWYLEFLEPASSSCQWCHTFQLQPPDMEAAARGKYDSEDWKKKPGWGAAGDTSTLHEGK